MPTKGETCYSYTKSTKNCGTDGVMEVYKLNERYESKNDGVNYNYKKFNYLYEETGEYDGYPNYSSDTAIPNTYIIKTQVVDGLNNSEIYTYNKKLLPINIIQEGTNHKNETINEYDATTNLLLKTVNKRYNKVTGAFVKNVEDYEYDTSGYRDMIGYWDSHTPRDNNDMITNNAYKIKYEYEPTYHYIVKKSYLGTGSKTMIESYIPTSDSKAIEWIKIYENAGLVSQTWYNYDTYGNIIEERRYLNNNSTPTSTYYSYSDNNSERNGKFNGAYLTRKWNNNVKSIDEVENNSSGITVEETFKYDWFGNIIEIKDGNGNKTEYEFDKLGRVIKETHQDGTYKTWQYIANSSENSVVSSDENRNSIKTIYDKFGNVMYKVDVSSGQYLTQYTYDSQMRLKTESNQNTSPSYSIITYNYDSAGRLLEKITKDQQDNIIAKENYTYEDAVDGGDGILYNKVSKTILGDTYSPSITLVEYKDNLNQVVKSGAVHNGREYLSTFKYDLLGNKIEEKSARAYDENWSQSYTTKYEYTYQGKVSKQYNIIGDFISNTYDKLGRLEKVTDIKGNKAAEPYSTTYEYDNLGRVIKETIPFDKSSSTIINSIKKNYYDRNGNKIKEKVLSNKPGEPESYNTTSYEYNDRNMLTTVITYDNGEAENYTQYYYDAVGNKVRMYTGLSAPLIITGLDNVTPTSDSEYSVTKYEYDRFGRLKKITDPMNMEENYSYDLNGNLLQKIDKNGSTITMAYDGMGRLLTKTVVNNENPSLNASYSYTYTLTGNKKTMSGGGTNTTYYYDDLGRLIKEVVSDGSQKEYAYDAANNRISLKISQNGVVKTNTIYTYDNLNRLSTVLENGVLTATYTYDENGNRKTLSCSNGNLTKYNYNLANKLLTLSNENGNTVFAGYTYTYYLNGNQATKTDNTDKTTTYIYDGLGRITSESTSGEAEITYTYDDNNNRKTMTVDGIVTSYEYDKNNRLLTETKNTSEQTTGITRYCYNNNGNTLYKALETISSTSEATSTLEATVSDEAGEVTINEYDGFNQLVKTETGNMTAEYAYNADGLRTSKTVNGVKTNHIWDGDQIALETDDSGNVTNKYVRGINLLYSENATGTKQYYLFNGHGDVVQLTGADGILTKRYDYDAFGNEKNPDASDTNVFRYCGEYFDKETGTIYLRARYYDPEIGRFITEDSYLGKDNDPLSLNLYTYCHNDGVNYIDPSGHAFILSNLYEANLNKDIESCNQKIKNLQQYLRTIDTSHPAYYSVTNSLNSAISERAQLLKRMEGLNEVRESSANIVFSVTLGGIAKNDLAKVGSFIVKKNVGEALSGGKIEHVLKNHTYGRMKDTVNKMMEKGLIDSATKLLNDKSFFNPGWSEQKVATASNKVYNKAVSQGITNGSYTAKVYGENVTVYIENGVFRTAYGNYKLTLSDFGF